jgi:dTDP-4-amino-4,6-dideoxygalactose transaminase
MINYGKQSISQADIEAVVSALSSDFLTTGPLVEEFELQLEKIVGAPCVSVSSGTAALHCAFAAIELKPGDEIITSPITFIATQATAALLGAKIVFVDVELDTGNIDPNLVEAAITKKTKAIVCIDFAGKPSDLDKLQTIAKKHGVYLIEDAAHAIGSEYKGRKVGSIADITTFSFYPTKNITTAEGGAISSPHPNLLKKAKSFARQGLIRDKDKFVITTEGPWHQEVHNFGLNYRLPDVLCALGISQLNRINEFKEKRQSIFNLYQSKLSNCQNIRLPQANLDSSPMWHLYPIHVPEEKRLDIFKKLRECGILVQVNYMPAYWHPVFLNHGYHIGQFPMSDKFYRTEISLPMHTEINPTQISFICESLIKFAS